MRTLSAAEAITPAINRTRAILFQPFRKGRSWKLATTAYLCRVGTMFFPFPLFYLALFPAARISGPVAAYALVIGVVLLTGLFLFVFHLCSRLQFAFFDIVANRGEYVGPAWRKYGRQSLAWTGMKVALGTVVTLACALPIAAYVRHILPMMQAMATLKPGQPPPPEFMAAIFAGYGILLLIFGPFFLISSLLSDFIVPLLALENTGIAEAFRRVIELVRREPGPFALYVLLKVVLAFAVYMGAMLAWELAFILVTLVLFLVAGILGFLLHLAGIPSVVLTVMAIVIGVVWYLFCAFYTLLLTVGTVMTFLDAYTLYFFGGRYPLLGDLLDRSEPPPVLYIPLATYAYPPQPPALPE